MITPLDFIKRVTTETHPEWTDEHEAEWQRQLKRLDVETAVFAHDTKWETK